MIIEPKVREYICTTAHPQGCAESVRNQADYACKQGMVNGTKKALIIGCSTGYGLASRICALENCGADTLGIMFERQANGRRTATPGWYNTAEPPAAHGLRTHRHRACRIYQACAGDAPDADFLPRVSPPLPWVCPCMKNTEKIHISTSTIHFAEHIVKRIYSQHVQKIPIGFWADSPKRQSGES